MKTRSKLIAALIAAIISLGIAAQPAAAATINYAYGTPLMWSVWKNSAVGTNNGGKGSVGGGDFGGISITFRIQTVGANSGYIYGSAQGGAISTVTLTHATYSTTKSRCSWTFSSNIGGPFPVDCYRFAPNL